MQRRGTQAFPGGVHPTDGSDKTLSMDQVVKPYRPDIVTILSEQTFGGTCQFTVKPGESVIEGQLIGKPNAFLAAPLHASISGTVLDVKEVVQLGRKLTACVIQRENGKHDTAAECSKKKKRRLSNRDFRYPIHFPGRHSFGNSRWRTDRHGRRRLSHPQKIRN